MYKRLVHAVFNTGLYVLPKTDFSYKDFFWPCDKNTWHVQAFYPIDSGLLFNIDLGQVLILSEHLIFLMNSSILIYSYVK